MDFVWLADDYVVSVLSDRNKFCGFTYRQISFVSQQEAVVQSRSSFREAVLTLNMYIANQI